MILFFGQLIKQQRDVGTVECALYLAELGASFTILLGGMCMEFWTTLREAELNLFVMSGSGLGAVLLAFVAIAVVLRSRRGDSLTALLKFLPKPNKRGD